MLQVRGDGAFDLRAAPAERAEMLQGGFEQ